MIKKAGEDKNCAKYNGILANCNGIALPLPQPKPQKKTDVHKISKQKENCSKPGT